MLMHVQRSTLLENTMSAAIRDADAMQQIYDYGTTVLELPIDIQAHIVQKADELWEGFAAEDEFFAKVYHDQKAFLKKYRAISAKLQPNIGMLLEYGK